MLERLAKRFEKNEGKEVALIIALFVIYVWVTLDPALQIDLEN